LVIINGNVKKNYLVYNRVNAMDFSSTFLNFSPALATFLLALLPLTELRAAIPIGIFVYHLSPISAFFFAVAGNLLAAYSFNVD